MTSVHLRLLLLCDAEFCSSFFLLLVTFNRLVATNDHCRSEYTFTCYPPWCFNFLGRVRQLLVTITHIHNQNQSKLKERKWQQRWNKPILFCNESTKPPPVPHLFLLTNEACCIFCKKRSWLLTWRMQGKLHMFPHTDKLVTVLLLVNFKCHMYNTVRPTVHSIIKGTVAPYSSS